MNTTTLTRSKTLLDVLTWVMFAYMALLMVATSVAFLWAGFTSGDISEYLGYDTQRCVRGMGFVLSVGTAMIVYDGVKKENTRVVIALMTGFIMFLGTIAATFLN